VGASLAAHLARAEAEQVVLDGFFPRCRPEDTPPRSPRAGLQELGLPYAQDPAVTRQLAAFLRAHAPAGLAPWARPTDGPVARRGCRAGCDPAHGGVFNARAVAARLVEVVSGWWPEAPPIPLLAHESLELAVARGAAYYGLVRRGLGRRIGGGTAHALYVGLEKQGAERPWRCA